MSGSGRGGEPSPVAGIIAGIGIIIALALAWGLGLLQSSETERRQQIPTAYSRAAKADAERACVGAEASALFECVYEKVEASQEQARGEQNLSAQQRAASSALVSAVLALFTLIITGIGVWFVKRTLDATLEAVRDTSAATQEMQLANAITKELARPWVTIECKITKCQVFGETIFIDGDIIFRNVGQAPALGIEMFHEVFSNDGTLADKA